MIRDNILRIREEIASICNKLGRNPAEVTLVGVTKFATPPMIQEAIEAGLSHIAENKVQEAKRKFSEVPVPATTPLVKHMIGHLQTNKVKAALQYFDVIQSVDSIRLAECINREAAKLSRKIEIFVQINTSGEPQKYGIHPDEALTFFEQLTQFPSIQVKGVMTIAPFVEEEQIIRNSFRRLREIYEKMKKTFSQGGNIDLAYLSMGMSDDYPIALEEGSNMVRIGRAIFQNVK